MHFNDLIFKELIKRGYSLRGNTRVWDISDSKLWYLTPEQAKAYLDLVETDKYKKGVAPKELSLIQTYIKEVVKEVPKGAINIVDLGCGNGKKASLFIEQFKKENRKVRYCPIDISSYMVQKAMENVKAFAGNTEILHFQWNISDFENLENVVPLLRRDGFSNNLFLLLGNTLGNFEMHELLHEIRSSMKSGDVLLIGNGLDNHKVQEDIVKSCRENKGFDNFFSYIPLQLGFDKKHIKYDARFANSRIEFYYTIETDKVVEFQDKKVYFQKGDQIVVGVAYHLQKDELHSHLNMYFDEVLMHTSKDGSYCLALCIK